MVDFFKILLEAGILTAAFIIGALAVMLSIVGSIQTYIQLSRLRAIILGCFGATLLLFGIVGHFIGSAKSEHVAPPTAVTSKTSPTPSPAAATLTSIPTLTAIAPSPTLTKMPALTDTPIPESQAVTQTATPTPSQSSVSSEPTFYWEETFSSDGRLDLQRWDVYENGGRLVPLSQGIRLEQDRAKMYPYLISQVNPFPVSGDFEVEVLLRYDSVTNLLWLRFVSLDLLPAKWSELVPL